MSEGVEQRFEAEELGADASLAPVELVVRGSPETGWSIARNGAPHLALGSGYRLLRTERCGVCSTDLDRPFLPFPLPQVVGHELIARDADGERYVVEINASHRARGALEPCAFCAAGLASHCPERLVLGIHDLPGGFGPWVLAPVRAAIRVPDSVPDDVAVLVEPFAAALHGVDCIAPRVGDRVAVLGPRRLGLLAVAALAARRRQNGSRYERYEIVAWSRHEALRTRALEAGADVAMAPPGADAGPAADIVIDTTGSADGFARALALARRELHLKSTHGQPSGGLRHTTALVVDELTIHALPEAETEVVETARRYAIDPTRRPVVAWLCEAEPPHELVDAAVVLRERNAATLLARVEARRDALPRADMAVVDRASDIDAAIRPDASREVSLVRPRGAILLHSDWRDTSTGQPLADAILTRGLRLTTSRCGSFHSALALLEGDTALREALGEMVTHRLPAARLDEALQLARGPDSIKVVVEHHDPGVEPREG